jgi:hypothetical protein
MLVQETVLKMMREFPWLYPTRVTALRRLFDASYTHWMNGELISTDNSGEGRDYLPYSPAEVADTDGTCDIRGVLFHRKENGHAQFVYDNAHLLSRDILSNFDKHTSICFDGARFADMPEDITADWLDAAKELATCIRFHKYWPDTNYAPEYEQGRRDEQAKAVKICEQFLERLKVIQPPCRYARAARVKELLREAQALGMQLTEADGSPPKVGV